MRPVRIIRDGLEHEPPIDRDPPLRGEWPNFRGTLSASGAAAARVNVPATLPGGLGITVFVAGVIFDGRGVVQVTQTHWIVLS